MKKIFLLLSFIFVSLFSFSQGISSAQFSIATGTDTYLDTTRYVTATNFKKGLSIYVQPEHTNTGPATLKINHLTTVALVKGVSTPLLAGDFVAGKIYNLNYDGTRFQINSGVAGSVGATGATGPTGTAGSVGATGPTGSNGATGATGPTGSITALGAIGSSANANGATLTGTTLNLEPASASFGGVVTTGTQTFAGAKTFGATTVTSINKLAITAPATSATLVIADGSTFTTAGTYVTTLTSTAATNVTLPTSGTVFSDKSASITSSQLSGSISDETGSGSAVFANSPTFSRYYTNGILHVDTTITVSSAQLLALFTTPRVIVAAPAAGSYIQVKTFVMFYDYGGTAYANVGNNIQIRYASSSGYQIGANLFASGFLNQTSDQIYEGNLVGSIFQQAATSIVGQQLVLWYATSNLTTGNGVVRVVISYNIVPSGF